MQNRGRIGIKRKIGDIRNLRATYGRFITLSAKQGENLTFECNIVVIANEQNKDDF